MWQRKHRSYDKRASVGLATNFRHAVRTCHQCRSSQIFAAPLQDVTDPLARRSSTGSNWQLATVVNSTLVVDPTIWLPGFDLHRRQLSLLNGFRTGQAHCSACHKKWGFSDNELCDSGEIQTMSHIVNSCPLTKFDGGLLRLHEADEAAVDWLTIYGS